MLHPLANHISFWPHNHSNNACRTQDDGQTLIGIENEFNVRLMNATNDIFDTI